MNTSAAPNTPATPAGTGGSPGAGTSAAAAAAPAPVITAVQITDEVKHAFRDAKYAEILPGLAKYAAPSGGKVYIDDFANLSMPPAAIPAALSSLGASAPPAGLLAEARGAAAAAAYTAIAQAVIGFVPALGNAADAALARSVSNRIRAMVSLAIALVEKAATVGDAVAADGGEPAAGAQAFKPLDLKQVRTLCDAHADVYGVSAMMEDLPTLPLCNEIFKRLTDGQLAYPHGTPKTSYLAYHAPLVNAGGTIATGVSEGFMMMPGEDGTSVMETRVHVKPLEVAKASAWALCESFCRKLEAIVVVSTAQPLPDAVVIDHPSVHVRTTGDVTYYLTRAPAQRLVSVLRRAAGRVSNLNMDRLISTVEAYVCQACLDVTAAGLRMSLSEALTAVLPHVMSTAATMPTRGSADPVGGSGGGLDEKLANLRKTLTELQAVRARDHATARSNDGYAVLPGGNSFNPKHCDRGCAKHSSCCMNHGNIEASKKPRKGAANRGGGHK